MGLKGFLTTLGIGIGAMYFLDPERGDQRRTQVREQVMQLRNEAQNVWTEGSEDLANRMKGIQSKASSPQDLMQAGKEAVAGARRGGMQVKMDMNRPGDRLLAMSGGGLLTLFGLTRGGIIGKIAMLAGLNFVGRGLAQKDFLGDAVTRMRGESGGSGIEMRKALRINAPVEEVYNFWLNYDNFPRFMSHLKEVRDMGNGMSHWVANGPADVPVEWDAQITEQRPNRVLAWESVPGSEVYNAGRVRFEPMEGATRVDVFMTYNPPGGIAGHAIAQLFGVDPKSAMDEDLMKLKSLVEQGTSAGTPGAQVRRQGGASGVGGDSGLNALEADITGDSTLGAGAGFEGGNLPSERKPGADVPGAGS